MTKEEYKKKMCSNCIHNNTKCKGKINFKKGEFEKIWCENYINVFECAKKQCNKCNKYKLCNYREELDYEKS